MNRHPLETAVVFSAPQGFGKGRQKEALMKEFGCLFFQDDWEPMQAIRANTLHLTNMHPDQLEHLRCRVVSRGWS